MSSPQWQSQVVPARLGFLAIYNPSLGPTDETFADQVVFYYSRVAQKLRTATRKNARSDAAGGDALREQENEKLRQIGLAQGMVDFARSFSDGQPVDSIDTEKSRIVLHELEPGWWILASVDLTRLPGGPQASADSGKKGSKAETAPSVEYSSREVSPSTLLLQQLLQAHHVFALHHGPSLTELCVRLTRERFSSTLDRYWTRFLRTWDVLLHGNPATDIFPGIKLSGGGEIGMGVGEEDWGSGEREVLEDLARRTEGLVDIVVSRFGEPAASPEGGHENEDELLAWLGSGNHPFASDGVIFGGTSSIAKPSLRNVSLWMRQIYTYGDRAYGVRDNPLRERRKRRRRDPPRPERVAEPEEGEEKYDAPPTPKASRSVSAKDFRPEDQRKAKSTSTQGREDASLDQNVAKQTASHPGIPRPIVSAAETSLSRVTKKVDTGDARSGRPDDAPDSGTTLGIPDQYMKYLTFGLSTLAKPHIQTRPVGSRRTSTSSSKTVRAYQKGSEAHMSTQHEAEESDEESSKMTHLEPAPDGESLQQKITIQKREENRGQFVIGLKGNLKDLPEDEEAGISDGSLYSNSEGTRTILRTVQVEIVPKLLNQKEEDSIRKRIEDPDFMPGSENTRHFRRLQVLVYVQRPFMYCFLFESRTSSLSIPGFYKSLHRDLSAIQARLLSSTSQARIIQRIEETHNSASMSDTASGKSGSKSSSHPPEPAPIYDLIWDPALMTVHTSIPNIPEPGTPAAEGISISRTDTGMPTWPSWTRVEALNVHSQILNTLSNVSRNKHEYERTSKTSRGWWVVWMKLSPSESSTPQIGTMPFTGEPDQMSSPPPATPADEDEPNPFAPRDSDATIDTTMTTKIPSSPRERPSPPDVNRIAFLVRKASDVAVAPKPTASSRAVSSMWNSLSLRPSALSDESTGGTSAGWGPAALAGGIGVDARKYIEGLLSLNR